MDWAFVGALIVVLFIHEMGHLAAMWWFDYQDLRMFFIPFFGAAASGRKRTATGAQRAIVSLMGPLPGIFIGSALVFLWLVSGSEITGTFAFLFLALNALNLRRSCHSTAAVSLTRFSSVVGRDSSSA